MTARPNPELPSMRHAAHMAFEADYRIAHIHPDYETTIVAIKRDSSGSWHVHPIDQSAFDTLLDKVQSLGYAISNLRFHYGMRPCFPAEIDSGPSDGQPEKSSNPPLDLVRNSLIGLRKWL